MEIGKASMNNSSSSGGVMAPLEKPNVFISFREEDTGKGFVSHLNASLVRNGLKTYLGSNQFGIDDNFRAARLTAIAEVELILVVFSKNYAKSIPLLDELKEIVQGSKTKKQIIVPLFYDVEPSSVGTYGERLAIYGAQLQEYEEMMKDDKYRVHSWEKALTEAASYSGWDCTIKVRETQHERVEEIAKDVSQKLDRAPMGDLDFQISKLEQVAQLQENFSKEVNSPVNKRNHQANLKLISRLKMEKKFRLLRLTPDLLSHMEISKTTNTYF